MIKPADREMFHKKGKQFLMETLDEFIASEYEAVEVVDYESFFTSTSSLASTFYWLIRNNDKYSGINISRRNGKVYLYYKDK